MPHLVLEYTDNIAAAIDPQALIVKLSQVLLDSGQFKQEDIKARAIKHTVYARGLSRETGFIHVKTSILAGRSPEIKASLSGRLMATLRESVKPFEPLSITVEIADLEKVGYSKEVLLPEGEKL